MDLVTADASLILKKRKKRHATTYKQFSTDRDRKKTGPWRWSGKS